MAESFSELLNVIFQSKGSVFYSVLGAAAVAVVAGEVFWKIRKSRRGPGLKASVSQDDLRMESLWGVFPILTVLLLAAIIRENYTPQMWMAQTKARFEASVHKRQDKKRQRAEEASERINSSFPQAPLSE